MVSVNSIFTRYDCSPLSDLTRSVQMLDTGGWSGSSAFSLQARHVSELENSGSAAARSHVATWGEAGQAEQAIKPTE